MVRISKKKILEQIIHLPNCPPKFYGHHSVIQADFQEVKNPLAGYGLTPDDAVKDLRKKGYQGDYIFAWIPDPKKTHIFAVT